jgi:hypothetical protein
MISFNDRLQQLEGDLVANPIRISTYHDLPFAIFQYLPKDERKIRKELQLLSTRINKRTGKTVAIISLSKILWDAIEKNDSTPNLIEDEKTYGFSKVQDIIYAYLTDSDFTPLPDLLSNELSKLNSHKNIAFIVRAGCLAPSIYPISQLMDKMQGKTEVPSVLFYPGCREESYSGLRFMCMENRATMGSYRVNIY